MHKCAEGAIALHVLEAMHKEVVLRATQGREMSSVGLHLARGLKLFYILRILPILRAPYYDDQGLQFEDFLFHVPQI